MVSNGDGSELVGNDRIVRRIVAMLINRTWEVSHSQYVLSKEFDVGVPTVMRAYADARRIVRLARDSEATRLQVLMRAREISDQDDPDRVPALTLLAKMTGTLEPPPREEMRTPEERVAYLRECLREPDDELLEALQAERESVLKVLAVETEGEESGGA